MTVQECVKIQNHILSCHFYVDISDIYVILRSKLHDHS